MSPIISISIKKKGEKEPISLNALILKKGTNMRIATITNIMIQIGALEK